MMTVKESPNITGIEKGAEESQRVKGEEIPLDLLDNRPTTATRVSAESSISNPFLSIRSGDAIRASASFPFAETAQADKYKKIVLMAISCLFLLAAIVLLWKSYVSPGIPPDSLKAEPIAASEASSRVSIAVLPFASISGNPNEDDGITEQIIAALSKTPKIRIIARNSVFAHKGKPTKVRQVGRELGVRYVLEGSVQRSGDRLRQADAHSVATSHGRKRRGQANPIPEYPHLLVLLT